MPQVPIIMPQLGESIAEATIVDIKVKPGDEIATDQEIIDVETNKAVMGVTTPCKGKIDNITAQVKQTYPVGTVLGYVEASEEDAARFKKTAPEPPKGMAMEVPTRRTGCRGRASEGREVLHRRLPVPAAPKASGFFPVRRARMVSNQPTLILREFSHPVRATALQLRTSKIF
jgi:pyruvate/2-oxoglutarate dehydrogenase complex dihydrolipoamide acyltransferase (E2) component